MGLTADVGSLQRLPKLLPDAIARELAYTGRRFLATEAAAHGFVNQVFADQQALLAGVMQVAASIAAKSPLVEYGSKTVLNFMRDHSVTDGLEQIATWNAALIFSDDLTESIMAHQQKRAPHYQNLPPPKRQAFD